MTRMPSGRSTAIALVIAAATTVPLPAQAADRVVESVTVARFRDGFVADAPASSLRSQPIDIDRQGMSLVRSGIDAPLAFELFADVRLTGRVDRLELFARGSLTATGRLEEGGWFVLAQVGDALAANFWTAIGARFEIRFGRGGHVASELDASDFGNCGGAIELPHEEPFAGEPPTGIPCSNVVDVLIVYTELARTSAGGEASIRAIAQASVASANLMYANSGIDAMLRLVHLQEVAYQETGNLGADLDRLRLPNDGHMDVVHALRDEFGADVVSLLVGSVSGICGTAYVMANPSPSFANLAFSVTRHVCAVGNMTFAHEIGHNLGCQHQHNQPGNAAFPHAYGHFFTGASGQAWRTVMAITPGTRIPFFSNPEVLYDGVPTGVPLDQPDPAHCALAINQTSAVASAFRASAARDCNGNGTDDACDLAAGTSADVNANGIPDECDGPQCTADAMTAMAPDDSRSTDRFGASVSLAADRLIAGADFNDEAGSNAGAAYVFRQAMAEPASAGGGAWTLEAKLVGSDSAAFDHFGKAVGLTPEGDWAIIGAFRYSAIISDTGAAYIFHRVDDRWAQAAKLESPTPAQQDSLGFSVGFLRDANGNLHALAGAPLDDEAAIDGGAVHVFGETNGEWIHQAILVAKDAMMSDRFGWTLSAAAEGRIIVGAPLADHGGAESGAAYIFALADGEWIQEARLAAPAAAAGDQFGHAVAIDAGWAVVGAPLADAETGAAYVFVHDGGAWNFNARLTAADAAAGDRFGWAVSVEGDRIVIGAPLDVHLGSATGSAYVFVRESRNWIQQAKINAYDSAPFDQFGSAVSIGPGAAAAAIGSPLADQAGAIDGGLVRVASLSANQPDCNGNSVADDCDIASGSSRDRNHNGVPDECEQPMCVGDVVGDDQVVDVLDLLAVINAWGPCASPCQPQTCAADVDDDCQVGLSDLVLVVDHWGSCPRP